MTGPEHYTEAERLLSLADYHDDPDRRAAAQVHATLALAAATVSGASATAYAADVNLHELNRWERVISPPAPVADEDEDEGEGDDHDGMTNADVIGADEMYEMDRDAEYAHDAAADALAADEDDEAGDVR